MRSRELPLGDLALPKGGFVDGPFGSNLKASEYVEVGVPIMRLQNIRPNKYLPKDIKFISKEKAESLSRHWYQPGDVVIAKLGAVGTACVIPAHCESGVIVADVVRFRGDPKEVSHQYLSHFLNSSEGQRRVLQLSKGTTRLRTNLTDLRSVLVPLPAIDDQIRIAHLLGKVEGLLTQRKQHLQQLDDLLKSVFLDMFGPTNPDHANWPLVEIRDLAAKHKGAMRTGPFGSNLLHSEFTPEGDVAVLGIDNAVQNRFAWGERRFISNEKYLELQSYRIFPGDVIVTIMGTIGRSAVIPDNIPVAINTKHLAAITLNREVANPLFLSYSIHSSPFILKQFAGKNRGAIMSGLNLGIIKETKIKRPPIGLQNRFAEIHSYVDLLKSRYQRSLDDLEALYRAVSQKAFKGELDLSRVPLPADQSSQADQSARPEDIVTPTEVLNRVVQFAPPESRSELLARWFNRYLANTSPDASLNSREFLESAWQTLQETRLESARESPALTLTDYDALKDLVFAALEGGTLMQTFAEEGNRVSLHRRPAGWATF